MTSVARRIFLLSLLLCWSIATMQAQTLQSFSVVGFEEKPFDTTARHSEHELFDGNGERFAIVKLYSTNPDDKLDAYSFDFGLCEHRIKHTGGELWLYVQRNAMHVIIKREGYKTVKHELQTTVQPGKVYELTLSPKEKQVIKRIVRFNITPADANAAIMYKSNATGAIEEMFGITDSNGSVANSLEPGTYSYRIMAGNYHSSEGLLTVDNGKGIITENVTLKPDYAVVTLIAGPGIDIYIDGEKAGSDRWNGRLKSGSYSIECRKEKHKSSVESITVAEGENKTLNLAWPTPITGSLMVITSPLDANIKINGKDYGLTPLSIDTLIIGKYDIYISKNGYKTEHLIVEIAEGEVVERNIQLTIDEESVEDADYAYNKGDYATAFRIARKFAEQGEALAQEILGNCYYYGNGVEISYTEAVKWYRKAAEQGEAIAQNNLGACYYNGNGVEKSYTEAVKWYRKAAEQGYALTQCSLGDCYRLGNGVEKSFTKAVKWYRKAAEQGEAIAQNNLGFCYDKGYGVEKSDTEAVKWYRKAAEQGYAGAQNNLGVCYYNGNGVEKSYTEAVKWFRKAAEQGEAGAQNNLGACYYNGNGVEKSDTEAVKWFRKAAEQGYALAQCSLGDCYRLGNGVEKSDTEAVKWFRKAAEQGDDYANKALERLGY